MSKLVMLSLGGSGERVMNSVVMLLAAGMRLQDPKGADMSLLPVFLDTDIESHALTSAREKIQVYQKLHKLFSGIRWGRDVKTGKNMNTLFYTKIEDPAEITIDGNTMGSLGTLIDEDNFDDDKKAELAMLYSPDALGVSLSKGFIGMPNLGTVALNYLVCQPKFQEILKNLQDGDRVFFISSIFGGTGAAGFPLILNKLQGLDIIKKEDNDIALGSVTMLPYFNFSTDEPIGPKEMKANNAQEGKGFTVNSDQFDSKSFAAFMYYDTNLDKNRISSQYFIGNTDKSLYRKCLGGGGQANPANLLEVACATSLFHFAQNAKPRNKDNKNISYYEYWSGKDNSHEYSLADIEEPEVKKALVRIQMFEYIMKKDLMNYTTINNKVVAKHYDFNDSNCKTLMDRFSDFFKLYDGWCKEMNSPAHKPSMQFEFYKHDPSENQFITECFNPSIAVTRVEGFIHHHTVVNEPDFLNKMSESMGNDKGTGWSSEEKEQFTLYLVMAAIEKVISQTNPYKIVKL